MTRRSSLLINTSFQLAFLLVHHMSVSYDQRVESVLSILNVTVEDKGDCTCSVSGNSSTVALTVLPGKLKSILLCMCR